MKNTSGLIPQGHAVLVRPLEPEFESSLIEIPATVRARTQLAETRAVVIEVGGEAWAEEKKPRAQPGDKVMIARFAGVMLTGPLDNKIYRAVNDRDIHCTIAAEAWPQTEAMLLEDQVPVGSAPARRAPDNKDYMGMR